MTLRLCRTTSPPWIMLIVLIMLICHPQIHFVSAYSALPEDSTASGQDDFTLFEVLQHGFEENSNLFREGEITETSFAPAKILTFYEVPVHPESQKSSHEFLKRNWPDYVERGRREVRTKLVPDPRNKQTVLNLADMSLNAYEKNVSANWRPVPGYNTSDHFGWDSNGLQGHVFGNSDRSILVMAIKGTTFKFFGEGGTSANDRLMDNLMFSCCCGRVDSGWAPVCGCYVSGNTCNQTCLENRMRAPDTYFAAAQSMYLRLRSKYPNSEIWFTGHSLGGALAGLLAIANDLSSFTYQSPGELLYANRIGLAIDRNNMQKYSVFHFGNDADPIFLGTCQGKLSTCAISSYAMESVCHVGSVCVYDGGFITNINNHRIELCIKNFYIPDPVPSCAPEKNCQECTNWKFA